MASLREHIEQARKAQQSHEQRHDVQLEIDRWEDREDDVHVDPVTLPVDCEICNSSNDVQPFEMTTIHDDYGATLFLCAECRTAQEAY